jgi:hypothetical protein
MVAVGNNPKPNSDVHAPELASTEKQNQKVSISVSKKDLGEIVEIKQPEVIYKDKTSEKSLV